MQPDEAVLDRVSAAYGVRLVSLVDVHGGADAGATLRRGETADGRAYAVKSSRSGLAVGLGVAAHLAGQGVRGVPAPLATVDGQLWTDLDGAQLSVVPWVAGRLAVVGGLDAEQWRSFGGLLAGVHEVAVPAAVRATLPCEDYRPTAAPAVRVLGERIRTEPMPRDELAGELVGAWRSAADRIAVIPEAAEELGARLRGRPAPLVLCHGDAHTANLLVADTGELWLIDWDGAVLAPRERDLMFVVDGVLADALVRPDEQAHFFAGYGAPAVDPVHLAYYRCAWALEDMAGFAHEIRADPTRTDSQRAQALRYFRSLLTPTGIVSLALAALARLGR